MGMPQPMKPSVCSAVNSNVVMAYENFAQKSMKESAEEVKGKDKTTDEIVNTQETIDVIW